MGIVTELFPFQNPKTAKCYLWLYAGETFLGEIEISLDLYKKLIKGGIY